MHYRENSIHLVAVVPFYLFLALIPLLPPIFFYPMFVVGIGTSLFMLAMLENLNKWLCREFDGIKLIVDDEPITRGAGPVTDYAKWPEVTEIFTKGVHVEYTDENGWTHAWIRALRDGYTHPNPHYNGKDPLHYVGFVYRGKWSDLVKYGEGSMTFNSMVVDNPHVAKIWVTEIYPDSLPDRSTFEPTSDLNLVPAGFACDVCGKYAFHPIFVIKRASGSIKMELEAHRSLFREPPMERVITA